MNKRAIWNKNVMGNWSSEINCEICNQHYYNMIVYKNKKETKAIRYCFNCFMGR